MELSTRSSHYLTSNQRAAIYGAYVFGLQRNASYQDIANLFPELRIDRHTVKRIADNYEKKGNFENAPKIGRPSTFQVEEEKILAEILLQPHGSITLAAEIIEQDRNKKFSDTTLSNHAHKQGLEFLSLKLAKKEQFTPLEKQIRMDYCLKLNILKDYREKFIFTDESAFPLQRKVKNKQ